MKNIRILACLSPILLLSCSSFLNAGGAEGVSFIVSSPTMGPYDGSESNLSVNVTYQYQSSKTYSSASEYMFIRNKDGAIIYRYYAPSNHSLVKGTTYTINLPFITSPLTYGKLETFYFYIYDTTTNDLLFTRIFTFNAIKSIDMHPFSDEDNVYTIYDCAFRISSTEDCLISEIFDFSDTLDYFSNETYYDIPLDNQKFHYYFPKTITYTSGYLYIPDTDGLFPYMNKSSGRIAVPLRVTSSVSTQLATIRYKSVMYVNPKTLEMSLTFKKGFASTNRFYLPSGKKDYFEGKTFEIVLNGVGGNKSKITMPITYYSSNNLFGYCSNSTYCVKGGLR